MQARAATYISADKELHTIEDVLTGVGHLIAERIGDNPELRGRLRRIFQRSGKIVCTKVETPVAVAAPEGTGDRGQETRERGQGTEAVGNALPGVPGVADQESGVQSPEGEAPAAEPVASLETTTSEAASAATVVMSPDQ